MGTSLSDLLRLNKSHVKPAADMCARAFQNDPLLIYYIPDSCERKSKSVYILQCYIRYGVLYGEVYATSQNLEGIAVWIPSGKYDMTLWRTIRSGWFAHHFKLGKESASRLLHDDRRISSMYKRHAPLPNWYLQWLGVDPVFQGQGYASILLEAMFARIDREHLPCYLETENKKNVPMYQHFGFNIVEEIIIPGTEVRHWAMLRNNPG